VQGSALLLARGDRPVRNERDARVSIHHCAACALVSGAAGVPEFAEPTVFRPDIASLRQKVRAELDASLPDGAARVGIHMASGETLSETVMAARGSLADPLSDFDIEAKLRDCSRLGGTAWNADTVIEDVWRLDALADVSSLMNAHNGPAPATERRHPARFVRRAETTRTQTWEGSTMSDSSLFEKGLKVRKEVLGEDYVNKSIAGADEFTRTMAEWSTEFCWGALWTRPGLDRRTRSIVNLAMLGALNRPHELKLHVKGALKNGLTKDEIKEILLQVAVYCGIPSGIDAFRNAREAFKEVEGE
jgi:4-carboxymuconolactone decarboxylase